MQGDIYARDILVTPEINPSSSSIVCRLRVRVQGTFVEFPGAQILASEDSLEKVVVNGKPPVHVDGKLDRGTFSQLANECCLSA